MTILDDLITKAHIEKKNVIIVLYVVMESSHMLNFILHNHISLNKKI